MLRGLFCCLLVLCWAVNPAKGHKLLLMAWVQGDHVMVETAFGDGTLAADILVTVLDAVTGQEVLAARSDAQGFVQLPLPPPVLIRNGPLLVRASDGAGHLAEQVIESEELVLAQTDTAILEQNPEPGPDSAESAGLVPSLSASEDEWITRVVREAVRQEVAPLRRDVIALSRSGPGIPEIMGGIGYIIGLASLAAWLLRKR